VIFETKIDAAGGILERHSPMQDDPETVEGDEREMSGDAFDDDDPDAPNLVPETGPSPRVLPGGFELRHLIGEGGMGQVFLGFHMRLECDVAVKVLDPELQLRKDSRERLLREGKVLAFDGGRDRIHSRRFGGSTFLVAPDGLRA
jgi:hypothetical protein